MCTFGWETLLAPIHRWIPDFPENEGRGWAPSHAHRHVEANYQLVVDNLLEVMHLTFVHKTILAGPGIQENPLEVRVEGDVADLVAAVIARCGKTPYWAAEPLDSEVPSLGGSGILPA